MKHLGRVIIVLFAIIIGLVFFEILLRLTTPEPENLAKLKASQLFLHENKPNAIFPYFSSGEFDNQISINSYGFRDSEFSTNKDPGTFRIAVLGDSQEEALQVDLPDTWQKVMARKLSEELEKAAGPVNDSEESLTRREGPSPNQRFSGTGGLARRVESYNFGVSGYGTDQEWLTLREKVWQFSPDMVILAFSPNDVGDTYKNKLVMVEDEKISGAFLRIRVMSQKERTGGNWLGKLVRETYTYHLVIRASSSNELAKRIVDKFRTKILGFPKEERFFLSDAQLAQGPFEVIASQKNPPKEVSDTWRLVRALVSDMRRQTGEHGAKFLITINIPRAQVEADAWELLRNLYHLDSDQSSSYQINEVMSQIAKELDIDFYDGRPDAAIWRAENGVLHYMRDAHFNKNGHLFMGTKVADYILEKKLIID